MHSCKLPHACMHTGPLRGCFSMRLLTHHIASKNATLPQTVIADGTSIGHRPLFLGSQAQVPQHTNSFLVLLIHVLFADCIASLTRYEAVPLQPRDSYDTLKGPAEIECRVILADPADRIFHFRKSFRSARSISHGCGRWSSQPGLLASC